jgi:hypothetical protein
MTESALGEVNTGFRKEILPRQELETAYSRATTAEADFR